MLMIWLTRKRLVFTCQESSTEESKAYVDEMAVRTAVTVGLQTYLNCIELLLCGRLDAAVLAVTYIESSKLSVENKRMRLLKARLLDMTNGL